MRKEFLLSLLGAATSLPLSARGAADTSARPNILFFLVDDMGWQDTSVPFWKDTTELNRTYHTPAMEEMARCGVRFTSAYAASVSSPTRVSLMTGMNPAAHRVTNWTLRRDQMPDPESSLLRWPEWSVNGIAAVPGVSRTTYVTPLPEILRANGYRTILAGKAHFGAIDTPAADPRHIGFDVNVAGHAAGGLASYLGEQNFGNVPGAAEQSPFAVPGLERYWGEDITVTEALTIEAKRQIDTALMLEKPFFLYMSHYAVHVPLDKDKRYYQKYRDRGLDEKEAAYAALVEGMDHSLGELRAYLREKGIEQNTVVIFLSDNGGLAAWGRGGKSGTQNRPLRSGKGSPLEGGIRVPMMVEWPGVTDSLSRCAVPVAAHDLMPTILSIAGVKDYHTVQSVQGQDISGLIRGEMTLRRHRPLVWHFPNMWDAEGDGIGPYSAIRLGDWKAVYYYDTGTVMMFNLAEDIFEKIDHGENPRFGKLRGRMLRRLTNELIRMNAQVPVLRATGEPCPWPDGSSFRPGKELRRRQIHY